MTTKEGKVRYGLSKCHYFSITRGEEGAATYGDIKAAPNAVSLTMTREGSDPSDFYADNGVCFSFAGTNGGYSMDWEFAKVTNAMRKDFLKEFADANGVQWETTDQEAPEMGMICEINGDAGPTAFIFFGIKASRVEMTENTVNESPSVQTETLHTRCTGIPLMSYNGESSEIRNVVKGFLDKTDTNATEYAKFFTDVTVPPTAAPAGN